MPHKRNPITMEKVCGLSRVVKANAQVAFDNVALWHERDISHSSAERVAQLIASLRSTICSSASSALSTACSCIPPA